MNMMVTADENWGIGYKDRLLVQIPSDQKLQQQMTMGKTVVIGRKALKTLPGGKPLPGRNTVILSRKKDFSIRGAQVVSSMEELFAVLKGTAGEDIYVLGGGETYQALLPYTQVIHVTRIRHRYQADTWFPDLDAMDEWRITQDSGERTYFDLEYEFLKYERI